MDKSSLDDNALAMVDFVLDNLGSPAGKSFESCLELFVLISDFDGMKALCLAGTGERQAALLRLVGTGSFDDLRMKHSHVGTLSVKDDDAFVHTDHVSCHAHASLLVSFQRFQ